MARPSLCQPCPTYTVAESLFAGLVAFGLLWGLALACGTPSVVQCRVAAVEFLPADPGQLTPYDVVDLVGRLRACEPQGDAGK